MMGKKAQIMTQKSVSASQLRSGVWAQALAPTDILHWAPLPSHQVRTMCMSGADEHC